MIDIYSEWPLYACLAVLFGIAASPVLKLADKPPSDRPHRLVALDGLRGILALSVYFHHAMVTYVFLTVGRWELPPSHFYALLGKVGVSVFFIITGYLFWSRLVQEKGHHDWAKLYIGRLFRIAPLFLFAIGTMFVIVAVRSKFTLSVPLSVLAIQLVRWLSLGLFGGDLNGIHADTILAGVTWSLRYEWGFYIFMPVLALAAKHERLQLPFTAAGLIASLALVFFTNWLSAAAMALFFAGMTCSSAPKLSLVGARKNQAASILMLALIIVIFTTASTGYSVLAIVCLGVSFYLVSVGCSLFGLLNTHALRRLGDISYGIYLLQGLILSLVVTPLFKGWSASVEPAYYWALTLAGAIVLIIVAMLTHVLIERPGIKLGRVAISKYRSVQSARNSVTPTTQQTIK